MSIKMLSFRECFWPIVACKTCIWNNIWKKVNSFFKMNVRLVFLPWKVTLNSFFLGNIFPQSVLSLSFISPLPHHHLLPTSPPQGVCFFVSVSFIVQIEVLDFSSYPLVWRNDFKQKTNFLNKSLGTRMVQKNNHNSNNPNDSVWLTAWNILHCWKWLRSELGWLTEGTCTWNSEAGEQNVSEIERKQRQA